MNFKYFTFILIMSLTIFSCKTDTKEMLMGKWLVNKVDVIDQISQMEKEDLERMEETTINFMKGDSITITMEGEVYGTQWTFDENMIDIKNGSKFTIQEISTNHLILESKISYYQDDEMIEYRFTQKMTKLQ